MGDAKLHHYVPQFYLRRFVDSAGRLWVWDREKDRTFSTRPGSVAAESNFYFQSELVRQGHDPLTMEKQFADLEGETSAITGQWLDWIRHGKEGDSLTIPDVNREIVSLFLALQFLRTADARSILADFCKAHGFTASSDDEKRALHTELLWNDELISLFSDRARNSTWLFGRNETSTPFITSDNPVAFRTPDNRMWLKAGVLREGTYIVYPLAPDAVMYCYPDEGPWRNARISRFDCQISPVTLTHGMIQNENTAQVFMASRFIISNRAAFDHEREFAKTIGTDTYAPPGRKLSD
ncbi:DUF4238 domain-containing protein [Actinoallomurus sp. NBC_01490]|uniref:DUF4238 domain-containing protein n=1 Tax=Actinoallomurus sp. NBC_01490 TaxID=2903557 RepID=UPI002E3561BA|nr:DUF4238 domain-containing protein [Actinoallomurus sp. NBC_01490]